VYYDMYPNKGLEDFVQNYVTASPWATRREF
jgi:hypothetical protein